MNYSQLLQKSISYNTFLLANNCKLNLAESWARYWIKYRGAGLLQSMYDYLEEGKLKRILDERNKELMAPGIEDRFPLKGILRCVETLRRRTKELLKLIKNSPEDQSSQRSHLIVSHAFCQFYLAMSNCMAVYPYTIIPPAKDSTYGSDVKLWIPSYESEESDKPDEPGGLDKSDKRESGYGIEELFIPWLAGEEYRDSLRIITNWGSEKIKARHAPETATIRDGITGLKTGLILNSADLKSRDKDAEYNLAAGYLNDVRIPCELSKEEPVWAIVCYATAIPGFFERMFPSACKYLNATSTPGNDTKRRCVQSENIEGAIRHLGFTAIDGFIKDTAISVDKSELIRIASKFMTNEKDRRTLEELLCLWWMPIICTRNGGLIRALVESGKVWISTTKIRDQIMGQMAHEIGGPISTIDSLINMFRDQRRNATSKVEDLLDTIKGQVKELDAIADLFNWRLERIGCKQDEARCMGEQLEQVIHDLCIRFAFGVQPSYIRDYIGYHYQLEQIERGLNIDKYALFRSAFEQVDENNLNRTAVQLYWPFLTRALYALLKNALKAGWKCRPKILNSDRYQSSFVSVYYWVGNMKPSARFSGKKDGKLNIRVENPFVDKADERIRNSVQNAFSIKHSDLARIHTSAYGISSVLVYLCTLHALNNEVPESLEDAIRGLDLAFEKSNDEILHAKYRDHSIMRAYYSYDKTRLGFHITVPCRISLEFWDGNQRNDSANVK